MKGISRNVHRRKDSQANFVIWVLGPIFLPAHKGPSLLAVMVVFPHPSPLLVGECYLWSYLAVPERVCDHLNRECVCHFPISMPLCAATVTFISLALILACCLVLYVLCALSSKQYSQSEGGKTNKERIVWLMRILRAKGSGVLLSRFEMLE